MSLPPSFSGFGGIIVSTQSGGGAPGQTGQNGGLGGSGAGGSAGGNSGGNAIYGWCVGGVGSLPCTDGCDCNPVPSNPVNCVSNESIVTLADGSELKISSLSKGDVILGIDCDGAPAFQTVRAIEVIDAECMKIVSHSGEIICSRSHVFIGQGVSECPAHELKEGDSILAADGTLTEIISLENMGNLPVVAIEVIPNHMFVSNGMTHHNKTACALRATYE